MCRDWLTFCSIGFKGKVNKLKVRIQILNNNKDDFSKIIASKGYIAEKITSYISSLLSTITTLISRLVSVETQLKLEREITLFYLISTKYSNM